MTGRSKLIGLAIVACLLAAGVVASTMSSAAAESSTSLLRTSVVTDGQRVELIRLDGISMKAGTSRYLNAWYDAHNPHPDFIMQQGHIRCVAGGKSYSSVYTTRNTHRGRGQSRITMTWLFTAPVTATYTCSLWATAKSCHANKATKTCDPVRVKMPVDRGYLLVTNRRYPGAVEWRDDKNLTIQSGHDAYVLRKVWKAEPGATKIGANADVELTHHASSVADSNAKLVFTITQVGADHRACVAPQTYSKSITLDSALNHDKVYFRVRDLPVSTSSRCASPATFHFKVRIFSTGPNAIDFNAKDAAHYSNGIAMTTA